MTTLGQLLDTAPPADVDAALEAFVEWVEASEITLYDAQEEAMLELASGQHVVLGTPTGSGKSLVAVALHFFAICTEKRSYYTSPIKALVSEKFFSLCQTFGAERVGMVTGDASINANAPIICCTAEILANLALKKGTRAGADCVIMDEFHYYSDRDRGWAWQVPLLTLPNTQFLLMSATLGDITPIRRGLEEQTGREVAHVKSTDRPVPLTFAWRDSPIQETIEALLIRDRAPVYVVQFTQRACAELAQSLTSINPTNKEEKQALKDEIGAFRFDSPYGKDMRRFLTAGIGLHHAGLLPKYRLLVERLAQKGLLKVIVGTDTLGVGINVPIRSVLFAKLCKFDGEKVRVLSVRDFKQIGGRAGRRGYDTEGFVFAQAPEHVIENRRAEAKAKQKGKKKYKKSQPPTRGYVHFDEGTFEMLQSSPAEALEPRFEVNHGMILQILQREIYETGSGIGDLDAIIDRTALRDAEKEHAKARARVLTEALVGAGIVESPSGEGLNDLVVADVLQDDFSLFQSLSLFLVDALDGFNQSDEDYALRVIGLAEAIQENPTVVLMRQVDRLKGETIQRLKGEGVDYEDRMKAIEDLTWPKPNAEELYEAFNAFSDEHPWLIGEHIRPKSVAREMYEGLMTFGEYIREYQLSRSEGVVLRYLSQVWRTLRRNVPEGYQTDELVDAVAWLRALLTGIDSSLITEWERLQSPVDEADAAPARPWYYDKRAVKARIRAEMLTLLKALSLQDYEAAGSCVSDDSGLAEPEAMEQALAPFFEEWGSMVFDHRCRLAEYQVLTEVGRGEWRVRQTIRDAEETGEWFMEAVVTLTAVEEPDAPIIRLREIAK
ncbi:MAG: superfamily II RNA helicase [Bradymonadia bacterium]|jgi:superfamily II RNA helicase